ncbi:hypothetical protein Tco_0650780 [Tanacetum coccineum]
MQSTVSLTPKHPSDTKDHLKMEMEMEIPSSSNVKLITECSDTTYTCYEVMKDLIKVSKLPQTLISYSSSQGLSLDVTQSSGESSDTSEGYERSGSSDNIRRSDDEDKDNDIERHLVIGFNGLLVMLYELASLLVDRILLCLFIAIGFEMTDLGALGYFLRNSVTHDFAVTFVDDEGKPLEKVVFSGDYDSEDEVASVDNEMASFFARKDVYGTNSLLEQWKESYENDDYDYDPYDDDLSSQVVFLPPRKLFVYVTGGDVKLTLILCT